MRAAERLPAVAGLLALFLAPLAAQDSTAAHATHMEWGRSTYVLSEVFEFADYGPRHGIRLDLLGWTGGSTRRTWFKLDADLLTGTSNGFRPEVEVLRSLLIAPYWDLQGGAWIDLDLRPGRVRPRGGVAIALQGLAPGWFDVETTLLLGTGGRFGAGLTASHDLYLTQRLVLQPRIESEWEMGHDSAYATTAGLRDAAFGLRLRFEARRQFAPYVGLVRRRAVVEGSPGPVRETYLALGLRFWR